MAEHQHQKYSLPDRSYQGIVRSELRKLAIEGGFSGHRLGEIELIIAEVTSNLVKHAIKGGILLARILKEDGGGFELIAIDDGPGIKLTAKMMEDGQTTKGTLGQGLGAIKRLSDLFDIYSMVGWGTIVFSRSYIKKNKPITPGVFEINGISVAKKDEVKCGDAWSVRENENYIKIAMIDGLGHGASAHNAATIAVEAARLYPSNNPVNELRHMHDSLKKTRGAVVNITHLDKRNKQLVYSGVGNISMKVLSPGNVKACFSYNGIVGHILPASLNNHNLVWNEQLDVVVMHSDGITTRWDLSKYPGILQRHGSVVSAVLYKDHDRGTDDSTVIVGKISKAVNG
ncbi:MAG TPA: ATP-binding protein [Chitinophagaceae bacterium]|nr:ATP-binding protein [Chitinophagaceae bacterium]